jgi:methylmalonyl-CoA mutase N-terminal domain/subunit
VKAAVDAGLEVDEFAPRLSFFFNAHNNFFEEIAKYRAARRMWARIIRYRFKAKNPRSWRLRFHAQTAGSTLTAQQPMNNVVRVTLQALAAVLGGTQSLHTNSMDEALWLPTEDSVRVALRTQQIIAHESGITDMIDPLAGSYHIEYLTQQIEDKANTYINTIDELGGAVQAIEHGYLQAEIAESAYQSQLKIEQQDQIIVGVNKFQEAEGKVELTQLKVDPVIEQEQRQHLAVVRKQRNTNQVSNSLSLIDQAARSANTPIMPLLINAVSTDCTLGEICGVLRERWGEYHSRIVI